MPAARPTRLLGLTLAFALALGAFLWMQRAGEEPARVGEQPVAERGLPRAELTAPEELQAPAAPAGAEGRAAPAPERRRSKGGRRTVRATVVDGESGEPIFGAVFHGRSSSATSNRAGELRYSEPEPGAYPFVVEASGYAYLQGELDPAAEDAGEPLVLPLLRSTPIRGRVLDGDGYPLRYVLVRLLRADGAEGVPTASAPEGAPAESTQVPEGYGVRVLTDDEGRFELPGAVPWTASSALRFTKVGYEPELALISAPGPGRPFACETVLRRTWRPGFGEVAGTVLLNGTPIESDVDWEGEGRGGYEPTRPDGFFRFDAPAGQLVLRAYPDGWSLGDTELPLPGSEAAVEVQPGTRTWVDLALVVPMATLSGRVTFADGTPCDRRRVWANTAAGDSFLARTDASGDFVFELPDLGEEYLVYPSGRRDEVTPTWVPAGTSGLSLVVRPHDN
ncbi:MAG: carboxypeptidase regulatory-like domain-containing protein [Planctomycetota bacterium]